MRIYSLRSAVDFQGELVFIKDGSKRIFHYFVLGTGSGKFLDFTTVTGRVDPPYNVSDMADTDYLEPLTPVVIFSGKARSVLEAAIPDELEFHPMHVAVDGQNVEFHIAKTLVTCPLIDEARSTFLKLAEAEILDQDVYLPSFDVDFHIARDPRYRAKVRVSQRFVDLCRDAGLRIDFKAMRQ